MSILKLQFKNKIIPVSFHSYKKKLDYSNTFYFNSSTCTNVHIFNYTKIRNNPVGSKSYLGFPPDFVGDSLLRMFEDCDHMYTSVAGI